MFHGSQAQGETEVRPCGTTGFLGNLLLQQPFHTLAEQSGVGEGPGSLGEGPGSLGDGLFAHLFSAADSVFSITALCFDSSPDGPLAAILHGRTPKSEMITRCLH